MRNRRLLDLYGRNARKGSGIRAESGSGDNTIWIYDIIVGSDEEAAWWGGVSPEAFAKTLSAMTGPVTVRVNSPGGDVFAGMAMAQAIREYADGVTVQIDGVAASIASIIAIAASDVVASQGAFIMVHKAWTITMGNADDLLAEAALLDKIDGALAGQYRAKAGDATDWAMAMKGEGAADGTWFTAEEALAAGLIDRIAEPDKTPSAKMAWDLSAFVGAPAALAAEKAPRAELSNDLSARQGALYTAVEDLVENFTQFDQSSGADGAHYMASNPFAAEGMKCSNCAFYRGAQGCEVVAGTILPEAICKLWIIPQVLLTPSVSNTSDQEIAARKRRLDVALRLQPA